jgi:DNA-binding MarR family transcriptional regulator
VTEVIARQAEPAVGGIEALAAELNDATTALRRVTRRVVRRRLAQPALPSAEVELLVAVIETPGIGVAEAARTLGLAANTVSTLVGRLVQAGFIERTDDPLDRRAAVLRPTAAGRSRIKRWRRERADVLSHALARLSPDDRRRIRAAVGALRNLSEVMQAHADEAER